MFPGDPNGELAGATHRADQRSGHSIQPPLGGADQQCPFVISPPVKSLDLGLSRPGSCNLTGWQVRLREKKHIRASARRQFLRRVKDIMYSHYLPLYEAPDKRGTPNWARRASASGGHPNVPDKPLLSERGDAIPSPETAQSAGYGRRSVACGPRFRQQCAQTAGRGT
jgi:hypothetical protein